jgi:hypothetical protein
VWPRREPILDRDTVDGIIKMLTAIHANLELLIEHFGLREDDEEEEDGS